ncbi:hypothetical protein ACS0TY_013685 [Phlomoides rotata]
MSGTSEAAALNSPVMNNTGASQPQTEQQLQVTWPQYPSLPDGSVMITPTGNTMNTRKRGRPRKYGPDGNMNILASPQQPVSMLQQQQQQQQAFSSAAPPPAVQTEANPAVDGSASPSKKSRGRPRGSKNKKQRQEAASASASVAGSNGGFVPHVVNVEPGEDVASKIMSICQNGPRAVCVLSANGTISTVTLHQAATSGGTATYEVFPPDSIYVRSVFHFAFFLNLRISSYLMFDFEFQVNVHLIPKGNTNTGLSMI